jgi:hypothetical protein
VVDRLRQQAPDVTIATVRAVCRWSRGNRGCEVDNTGGGGHGRPPVACMMATGLERGVQVSRYRAM